jgi:formylglycine-generating enzyme required for sulfatase activity
MELCERLALELPSEAQWEYAARAGTSTVWWTGSERESLVGAVDIADRAAALGNAIWPAIQDWPTLNDGYIVHAPVSEFRANPFGLHNVHGNVWEWCRDGSDGTFYGRSPSIDPVCEPADYANRVARGGGFSNSASLTRSAERNHVTPKTADFDIGLRPARALTP